MVSRLLDHIGIVSLNQPPLKETFSDGLETVYILAMVVSDPLIKYYIGRVAGRLHTYVIDHDWEVFNFWLAGLPQGEKKTIFGFTVIFRLKNRKIMLVMFFTI